MKCPNCGAEVNGNVCEYCGSRIAPIKMKTVCPEGGSEHLLKENISMVCAYL